MKPITKVISYCKTVHSYEKPYGTYYGYNRYSPNSMMDLVLARGKRAWSVCSIFVGEIAGSLGYIPVFKGTIDVGHDPVTLKTNTYDV